MHPGPIKVGCHGDVQAPQPPRERTPLAMGGRLHLIVRLARLLEGTGLAVARRDEQRRAAQPLGQLGWVVGGPHPTLGDGVAPDGARVVRVIREQVQVEAHVREGMEQAGVGRGGAKETGMTRGVVHGTEAAHGQSGDHAALTRAVAALEDLPRLAQVEGLPGGPDAVAAAPPVRIEADRARLGHDHEHVAQLREIFDLCLTRPAVVGVATTV